MAIQLTSEQMLSRFEDRRDIINLMARWAASYLLKKEKDIFPSYWSGREDVSLGMNDGFYIGPEAISSYYHALDQKNILIANLMQKRFPEKFRNLNEEELYGVGTIGYKPLDTGVIEIAEDEKTAKGIWTLRGTYTDLTLQGVISYWVWGWAAADFVWEDDAWKIWHLLELYDVNSPCGKSWANGTAATAFPEEEIFAPIIDFTLPEKTIKKTVRPLYTVNRPHTPSPRVPLPYRTFDETFSYGPEVK